MQWLFQRCLDRGFIYKGSYTGAYCVSDDGIGFDGALPDQWIAIFGRLHARDEHGGGTGAGLALASRIAARHGGRLWGEGTPGAGASVWFTLG